MLTLAAVVAAVVITHRGEDGDSRDEVPDASEACARLRVDGVDNATAARCGRFLLRDGEVHYRPNYRAETAAETAAERAALQHQRDTLVQLREDTGRLSSAQSRTLSHLTALLRHESRAAASCALFYHPHWHYWVLGLPWPSWVAEGSKPSTTPKVLLMTSSPANTPEEVGSYTRPDGSLVDPWVQPLDQASAVALHGGRSRVMPEVRFVCESAPTTTVPPLHALLRAGPAASPVHAHAAAHSAAYATPVPVPIPSAGWKILTLHASIVVVMTTLALVRGVIVKGRRHVTVMTSEGGDDTTWDDRRKSWVWDSRKTTRLLWWQRILAGQVAGSDGGFRRARREDEKVQYELVVGYSGAIGSRGTMKKHSHGSPYGDNQQGFAYDSRSSDDSDSEGASCSDSDDNFDVEVEVPDV